jgi:hypothetical protein
MGSAAFYRAVGLQWTDADEQHMHDMQRRITVFGRSGFDHPNQVDGQPEAVIDLLDGGDDEPLDGEAADEAQPQRGAAVAGMSSTAARAALAVVHGAVQGDRTAALQTLQTMLPRSVLQYVLDAAHYPNDVHHGQCAQVLHNSHHVDSCSS